MVTSSKRTNASTLCLPALLLPVPLVPQQATVNPRLHWRSPDTHRQVWLSVFGGRCSFLWHPGAHRKVFSFQEAVSPVLWKFWNQTPLTFKVTLPEDSQCLCQTLMLGSLLRGLELSQQWKNFFGTTVFQFVDSPPGNSIVGLMETSSKRTYATCHASQDCCCQSPYTRGRPLLTHASAGDPQTLTGRSGCLFWGSLLLSLGPDSHKVLFMLSKCLWWVWGLILNVIVPLLPPSCSFSFALGCVVSFSGGFQHFPVDGCSATSCNFGALTKDEHTCSFLPSLDSLYKPYHVILVFLLVYWVWQSLGPSCFVTNGIIFLMVIFHI